MIAKRYKLPPLSFISGFEAAARNLSFTKAAEELFVTQSAVSKQIKALEDSLGVTLFERRTRELSLTDEGQRLYRTACELLDWLQEETAALRGEASGGQLAVTASTGFASLWLIPRLKRFRSQHPRIDVRIAATNDVVSLERSRLDVAIRYCRPEAAPEGAVRLFEDLTLPVCSPELLRDPSRPLNGIEDLRNHVLLHVVFSAGRKAYVDWESWLAAVGFDLIRPAGVLYFNQYEQMIQAAVQGQGVALGIGTLVGDLLKSGALVAPFQSSIPESRACFVIRSPAAKTKPHVDAFVDWLMEEARA